MSLTVRDKKSVVLFSTEELFILREALEYSNGIYYNEEQANQIYKDYGIPVKENALDDKRTKLKEKISKVFEASRVWDFEGFEYR